MERKQKTKNRRRRSRERSRKESGKTLLVVNLIIIVLMVSVYFRLHTGLLGQVVGGWLFKIFGFLAYFVLPYGLAFSLFLGTNRFHGKIASQMIYIACLLICWGMILASDLLLVGDFSSMVSYAAYLGQSAKGAGVVGAFFTFIIGHLIGRLGIYFLTAILAFFFILNLCDVSFPEFLHIMGEAFSNLRGKIKNSIAQKKEKQELKEQELKSGALPPTKEKKMEDKENPFSLSFLSSSKPEAEKEAVHQPITIRDYQRPRQKGEGESPTDQARNNREEAKETLPFTQRSRIDEDLESTLPLKQEQTAGSRLAERFERMAPESPRHTADSKAREESSKERKQEQTEKQLDLESLGLPIEETKEEYIVPPLALLKTAPESGQVDEKKLKDQALLIEKTLESFGIVSQVVSIQRGPTVTLFELKPQAGVKVSRITNLANDLALALAAPQIRIEAPIPGKPYVGIEVPNKEKATVSLREILESEEFKRAEGDIPVGLGKSISGQPVISKIARMPHLLIAGATGSGKSVCINTIITSILYRYSPKEVRFILIDPKVVELSVYNGIPHLLIPVVTDPKKAATALYMGVQEMERRFRLFSQFSVRDIQGWREKKKVEEEMEELPYIVIIIDELSDLMMVASKDVEAHITRLAQMARACGIHLIIATQRPSVDVITGTIKANIPSRISFAVSSSVDSRTILDQSGAEKLLGRGDMLYYPASFPKPRRVQGAYISDQEVSNIVAFIKDKHDPHYDKALLESIEKKSSSGQSGDREEGERDELMDEVLEFISHEETTSISGLQRRFRIGYARAGRIIDDLEAMGAVSAQDGSKPREVLIHADEKEADNEYTE